jgi:hypothetical protein
VESFDWAAWDIWVVFVEVDKPGNAFKMREFMKKTGLYQDAYRIDKHHPDDIYIRKNKNINPLDSFQVGCEERCRRMSQCMQTQPNDRFCTSDK